LGQRTERRVFINLAPLRRSRDLRYLVLGELVSVLGTQLTTVAVPYQVYQMTHSSLDVGGAATLGFLYAAPGAGALAGALTTGWVSRIRRQGRAVIVAVVIWGIAITCFGLVSWLPGALALLAVAGWADVISAVFRNTIIQLAVPDALRGRLSGLQIAVVTGGPRIGDLESGVDRRRAGAGPAAARLPQAADAACT
jgi:MFS family permease